MSVFESGSERGRRKIVRRSMDAIGSVRDRKKVHEKGERGSVSVFESGRVYVCVCACVCVHVYVCVWVCVCE